MGVQGNLVRDQSPEREVGGQCNSMAAGVHFWALGPPAWGASPFSRVTQDGNSGPGNRGL